MPPQIALASARTMTTMRSITATLLLTSALGACAAAPASPSLPADFPAAMRDEIWADAARRAGVDRAALQLASAQAVTWSDGALGCPVPGRLYTQALVPGWRIEVAAPGQTPLLYHASRRGGWQWCARERARPPLPADSRL
jgi:hypothetical protein